MYVHTRFTCTCVCDGTRAPALHWIFGLALRDVICEVYGHEGVEGHAVKGILVWPGHGEGTVDQPNPAVRLHRGISVSILIPNPLNRMDWLATRRIDSSTSLKILLARSLNLYSLVYFGYFTVVAVVRKHRKSYQEGDKQVDQLFNFLCKYATEKVFN